MAKNYFLFLVVISFTGYSQIVNIPDANFKNALVNTICADLDNNNTSESDVDTNNNGEIEVSEALAVFSLFSSSGGGNPPLRMFNNHEDEALPTNISDVTGIEAFLNLKRLNLNGNQLTTLDVSMLPNLMVLQCTGNDLTTLTLGNLSQMLVVTCTNNDLATIDVSGLPQLVALRCDGNLLTTLDLANNPALVTLSCTDNNLTDLDLSSLDLLQYLTCSQNDIAALDLTNLTALKYLQCYDNNITSLDFASNSAIESIGCIANNIATLDVSNLASLIELACSMNPLTGVSFENNNALTKIFCDNTLLQNIDLSQTGVILAHLNDNPELTQVFLKNGVLSPEIFQEMPAPPMAPFNFANTPNLEFICGDEGELNIINQWVDPQTVSVTSYCTFSPAGEFNTIAGNTVFNCGASEYPATGIRINVDANVDGATFSNDQGEFAAYLGMGQVSVSADLENPYFSVTPTSYAFNFVNFGNNATADFCIAANGIHPDLEVTAFSTMPPRPGFDITYNITLKNKGTETQSGDLSFTYDDAVLDYVSSNPAASSQVVNNAVWSFSGLQPFEVRNFTLTLNLNSPVETPAVNNGDILNLTASVENGNDETPSDNTFTFQQTVVGSFDPNDKTVLEGESVSIDQVGEYLHYLVRFQNTGTFAAENVVVKDMLSPNLLLNSLEVVSASHAYRSTLTEGNKLEFFFEGIDLPPAETDEPGSHGYVLFKIKPIESIEIADMIENTAGIYFDYNFPIVTNTVATTITQQLSMPGSELEKVSIHPNPATSHFEITLPGNAVPDSVLVYNSLGQLVKAVRNSANIPDVHGLTAGTYFVEINVGEEKLIRKLIKI